VPAVDLPIAAGLVLAWGLLERFQPSLEQSPCQWCEPNDLDRTIRDSLRWDDTLRAGALSDITAYGVMPLWVGSAELLAWTQDRASLRQVGEDLGIVLEAVSGTMVLSDIVKFTVGRQRPYIHYTPVAERPMTSDLNTSFFSGHTAFSFSIVTAAATVASRRGYRYAAIEWIGGLALAGFVGYSRIAADRHYFTDVLVGATVGSAVGIAVPMVHRRSGAPSRVLLLPFPEPGVTGLSLAASVPVWPRGP
jgi:membrane-associated phospholipid phosphatase